MSKFNEWMTIRDSLNLLPSHDVAQARSLKGLQRGLESVIQQSQRFIDPRTLVTGESRQELVRLANTTGQLTSNIKEITVSQYKSGRREASEVFRAADSAQKAAESLVMMNYDSERREELNKLQVYTTTFIRSASSLYHVLDQYIQ